MKYGVREKTEYMIKNIIAPLLILFSLTLMSAQDLPYSEIPEYPSEYSSGKVVARMIDGLGFRYYWATEGLTDKDLNYRPTEESRTVLEVLQHIYGMSEMILNAPSATPNIRPADFSKYSFAELRKMTLVNLEKASKIITEKKSDDFNDFQVIFQREEQQSSFPYWNLLNGMLSDCIYHTGQVTMLRRVTGNPINPNVSVFTGKVRK